MDSIVRDVLDCSLACFCWSRDAAVSKNSHSWATTGKICSCQRHYFSVCEMGIDFQSVYWETNTNYELSIEEIGQRNGAHSGWLLYENDFYQYKQGLMDEVTWKAKLEGIKNLYNKCVVRVVYDFREPVFSQEFREITQSFTNECTDL